MLETRRKQIENVTIMRYLMIVFHSLHIACFLNWIFCKSLLSVGINSKFCPDEVITLESNELKLIG